MNHLKNVTVSIPDDVYRAARVRAAKEGSSLSSLVADCLRSLSRRSAEFARLEAQERQVLAGIESFRGGDRLERGELRSRAVRDTTPRFTRCRATLRSAQVRAGTGDSGRPELVLSVQVVQEF